MIDNTHYNLIDTLDNAYGRVRFHEFCNFVINVITVDPDANRSELAQHCYEIRSEGDCTLTLPCWSIICECVLWARTEGNNYGMPDPYKPDPRPNSPQEAKELGLV